MSDMLIIMLMLMLVRMMLVPLGARLLPISTFRRAAGVPCASLDRWSVDVADRDRFCDARLF
jgi:hypothetical protein